MSTLTPLTPGTFWAYLVTSDTRVSWSGQLWVVMVIRMFTVLSFATSTP